MYSASRAAKSGSVAMRMPLVFSIRWRILWRFAAAMIANSSGCRVGSPPLICNRSGSPSLPTNVSSMRSTTASGNCPGRAGEEPAKHVGHVRLQVSLISISARQLCCS
jgi:hypothetical protein